MATGCGKNSSGKCVCDCWAQLNHKYLPPPPVSFFTPMQDGASPVYAASKKGHTEVVDLLVEAGADIHLATAKVLVSTHTVSSSVAAVVETNVRLITFVLTTPTRKKIIMHCLMSSWAGWLSYNSIP